jgi:hypothetical protein
MVPALFTATLQLVGFELVVDQVQPFQMLVPRLVCHVLRLFTGHDCLLMLREISAIADAP